MSQNLPDNWKEAFPGGMATNPDPLNGGIIDQEIVSKEWFIIFNRDGLPMLDGFPSRSDAFKALAERLARENKSHQHD